MNPQRNHPTLRRRQLLQGILVATGGLVLAGCAPRPISLTPAPSPKEDSLTTTTRARTLMVYFSRAGENYDNGGRTNLTVGNTKIAAGMIADLVSVDSYEIIAADPYPEDYEATVERNVHEQRDNARPAIAGPLPDLGAYDTILLGSPVWNVQAPMIMRTFVEAVDLAGKTVHPFVTYAVSEMGSVQTNYEEMLPESDVTEGLAVRGETVKDAGPDIQTWLQRIGLR